LSGRELRNGLRDDRNHFRSRSVPLAMPSSGYPLHGHGLKRRRDRDRPKVARMQWCDERNGECERERANARPRQRIPYHRSPDFARRVPLCVGFVNTTDPC